MWCEYGQTFRSLKTIGLLGICTHTAIYILYSLSLSHHTHTYTHHLRSFLNHQAGKLNSIESLNEFLSPNSNPGASHYRANSFFLSPTIPDFSPFCFFSPLTSHHLGFFSLFLVLFSMSVCSFLHGASAGFRKSDFRRFPFVKWVVTPIKKEKNVWQKQCDSQPI